LQNESFEVTARADYTPTTFKPKSKLSYTVVFCAAIGPFCYAGDALPEDSTLLVGASARKLHSKFEFNT
jgi:hypothetical protein